MLKTKLLSILIDAINTYLRLDPESKSRLARLQGKAITIELLPFHVIFHCFFYSDHVDLQMNEETITRTKISGTPLQMLGVMMTKENRQRFFADDLRIEGDAELANEVIQLFDELTIDWQEQMSRVIGDVPTHQFGRLLNRATNWLRQTEQTFAQDINEYVHEEAAWFPTREALQDFFDSIDHTRMDVDRLEAKILRLQQQIMNHANPTIKHSPEDEGTQ